MAEPTEADMRRANEIVLTLVDKCIPFFSAQDVDDTETAIAQAIADERDRCAKIAEAQGETASKIGSAGSGSSRASAYLHACQVIASAIRNQGGE